MDGFATPEPVGVSDQQREAALVQPPPSANDSWERGSGWGEMKLEEDRLSVGGLSQMTGYEAQSRFHLAALEVAATSSSKNKLVLEAIKAKSVSEFRYWVSQMKLDVCSWLTLSSSIPRAKAMKWIQEVQDSVAVSDLAAQFGEDDNEKKLFEKAELALASATLKLIRNYSDTEDREALLNAHEQMEDQGAGRILMKAVYERFMREADRVVQWSTAELLRICEKGSVKKDSQLEPFLDKFASALSDLKRQGQKVPEVMGENLLLQAVHDLNSTKTVVEIHRANQDLQMGDLLASLRKKVKQMRSDDRDTKKKETLAPAWEERTTCKTCGKQHYGDCYWKKDKDGNWHKEWPARDQSTSKGKGKGKSKGKGKGKGKEKADAGGWDSNRRKEQSLRDKEKALTLKKEKDERKSKAIAALQEQGIKDAGKIFDLLPMVDVGGDGDDGEINATPYLSYHEEQLLRLDLEPLPDAALQDGATHADGAPALLRDAASTLLQDGATHSFGAPAPLLDTASNADQSPGAAPKANLEVCEFDSQLTDGSKQHAEPIVSLQGKGTYGLAESGEAWLQDLEERTDALELSPQDCVDAHVNRRFARQARELAS